jgi:hypothetical protein
LASNILMRATYRLCCNITNGISGYALPWDPGSSTWWLFRTLCSVPWDANAGYLYVSLVQEYFSLFSCNCCMLL